VRTANVWHLYIPAVIVLVAYVVGCIHMFILMRLLATNEPRASAT
jgi:NADH:ubiquinone oxidoreductase subunit 3 (subunit A)